MPLTDLGIDPDTDLADQYPFTKTTASDANGVQRGSTWQCCPRPAGLPPRHRSGHLRHRRPRGCRRKGQRLGYVQGHRRGTEGQGLLCAGLLRRHLPAVRQQHQPALGRRGHRHHHCRFPDHAVDQRLQGVAGRRLSEQDGQGPVQRRLEQVDGSASKVFAFLLPAWASTSPWPPTGTAPTAPGPSPIPRRSTTGAAPTFTPAPAPTTSSTSGHHPGPHRQQGQPHQDFQGLPRLHQHHDRHGRGRYRRFLCLGLPGRPERLRVFRPRGRKHRHRPVGPPTTRAVSS